MTYLKKIAVQFKNKGIKILDIREDHLNPLGNLENVADKLGLCLKKGNFSYNGDMVCNRKKLFKIYFEQADYHLLDTLVFNYEEETGDVNQYVSFVSNRCNPC